MEAGDYISNEPCPEYKHLIIVTNHKYLQPQVIIIMVIVNNSLLLLFKCLRFLSDVCIVGAPQWGQMT